ncbi:MAG: penicillin acylase family protein [Ktedonobacterales bacterium]
MFTNTALVDTHAMVSKVAYGPLAADEEVVDMRHLDASRFMLPLGESEAVGSPYRTNLLAPWNRGQYLPMRFSDGPVAAGPHQTLTLTP